MNDRPSAGSQVEAFVQQDGDGVVILRGEHDLATTPDLRAAFARVRTRSHRLLVDLGECAFLDSSVLGVLIGELRRSRERASAMIVVLPLDRASSVRRTLELTGLLEVFDVRESRDAAH